MQEFQNAFKDFSNMMNNQFNMNMNMNINNNNFPFNNPFFNNNNKKNNKDPFNNSFFRNDHNNNYNGMGNNNNKNNNDPFNNSFFRNDHNNNYNGMGNNNNKNNNDPFNNTFFRENDVHAEYERKMKEIENERKKRQEDYERQKKEEEERERKRREEYEKERKRREELDRKAQKEEEEREKKRKEEYEKERKRREEEYKRRKEEEEKERKRLQEEYERQRKIEEERERKRREEEEKERKRLQEEYERQRKIEEERERKRREEEEKERKRREKEERERKERELKEKELPEYDEKYGNVIKSHNSTIPGDSGHYLSIPLNTQKNRVFIPTKSDLARFLRDGLKRHNYYRKYHQAGPLVLTEPLNNFAQKYAETLAARGNMEHSKDSDRDKIYGDWTGENLYYFWTSARNLTITGADAVDSWYDEIKDYDFAKGRSKNGGVVGHFTALVWKGSNQLGMGVARSSQNKVFVVANYHPGGNMIGDEVKNVLRAKAK